MKTIIKKKSSVSQWGIMMESLGHELEAAGGEIPLNELERMSAVQLMDILACNSILFQYSFALAENEVPKEKR